MDKPVTGKVAVVAGATRGAGRAIAVELGAAGATVYVTDRSTRDRRSGLVVEVTDGADLRYRGNLFYDLAKASNTRVAHGMAEELRPHDVAAVALTPGFLRSEAVLEAFGVSEDHRRDGITQDLHFAFSESPAYIGKAVVALASDPQVMDYSGQALTSWGPAAHYGFTDVGGSRPDWGSHFRASLAATP